MSHDNGLIDERLRKSGEDWRSGRDVSSWQIDSTLFDERRRANTPARLLRTLLSVFIVAIIGVMVAVSLPRPDGQVGAIPTPSTPSSAVSPTASATSSPTPTAPASPANESAEVACSAILDDIPSVRVKSGTAVLAAAYEVTGDQLATYMETTFAHTPSQWRDQPTKVVEMCVYDGDFDTMTPGPPGHDTSAVRVLVVISDGAADLWAITRDRSSIPTTDPATMETEPADRPVDPSVRPVSRSHPGGGAEMAMSVCNVATLGVDAIAGMGLIERAADARDYAPLTGREPELESMEPAWMIQFRGEIPQFRAGEIWIDPVCIVIGDRGGFYATGPVRQRDGSISTPLPAPIPPSYALPPLAP